MIEICFRKVYIVNGAKTQTVNICSKQNKQGLYDYTVRIQKPNSYVSEYQLSGLKFNSLNEFIVLLTGKYKGILEKKPIDYGNIKIDKTNLKEKSFNKKIFNSDLWLAKAIPIVEFTINDFIKLFTENPFLHRCEHSIHCELYYMLLQNKLLNEYAVVDDFKIRLIHKEWPEYNIRSDKNKRGETDIAILSPTNLKEYSINDYKNGTIEAPIAIELGLDYKYNHFEKDISKLINSNIYMGYIIHLVRETEVTEDFIFLENAILEAENNYPNIKIAYARFGLDKRIYKKSIGDKTIITLNKV